MKNVFCAVYLAGYITCEYYAVIAIFHVSSRFLLTLVETHLGLFSELPTSDSGVSTVSMSRLVQVTKHTLMCSTDIHATRYPNLSTCHATHNKIFITEEHPGFGTGCQVKCTHFSTSTTITCI